MKILLVAPGATWSTYDIYKYYLEVMHKSEDVQVQGFNFHNEIIYHKFATNEFFPHYSQDDLEAVVSIRAARDLILDAIIYKPDVILFVAATLVPGEIYRELLNVRAQLDRPFAIAMYFTESPYMDSMQETFIQYADVLFVNDKVSVKKFDPKGNRYVEYLPHSFNPKVHRPGNENDLILEGYESDIFFGATVFRERLDMIANIDWKNINLKLAGNWVEWLDKPEGQKLERYMLENSINIPNLEYAKYYRGTKIALNVHRTRGDIEGNDTPLDNYTDAYSIGPRLYEAVACGAFVLTDYRKEAEDLFGDTIEFFDGNDDLEKKIHYWLDPAHEQERINMANAAREKIQNCTFSDRLHDNILPTLREVLKLRRIKNE